MLLRARLSRVNPQIDPQVYDRDRMGFFSKSPDLNELRKSCAELLERQRDLDQRFKVIEREHEDLHRAYRRLRASNAAEARDAPKSPVRDSGGNGEYQPTTALTKDVLRRMYLAPKRAPKPPEETE